jgi:hypothetical protein
LGGISDGWITRWLDRLHRRDMVRGTSLGTNVGNRGLVNPGSFAGLTPADYGIGSTTTGADFTFRFEPSDSRDSVERRTSGGKDVG